MGNRDVSAGFLCLLLAAGAAAGAPGDPAKRSFLVPMSDGVKLATDVYLPAAQGAWPVVLTRTPYNKNLDPLSRLSPSRNRCAFVIQDMRGRFASGGENIPFVGCGWAKHTDGVETLAWLLNQPWCNGKIGTLGGSACGITQNLLAGAGGKGLTSQYIQVAAASLYQDAAYVGGALRLCQVEGWTTRFRFDRAAERLARDHPMYDDYWMAFDSTTRHAQMTTPAVHAGGWFDTFSQGTIDSFLGRQNHGGPGAAGTQKLVMGPWGHDMRSAGSELRFPNSSLPERYSPVSWFAQTLVGVPTGSVSAPAVAYYVMGDATDRKAPGNEWRYSDRWPVPAAAIPFYFGKDGSLARTAPAAQDAFREYTFDPANPCPTIGGRNLTLPRGPMDQRRAEARKDVLTFTTPPLAAPLEVTGRITARVWLSSSAVDTDLSVRFCDVYPGGGSYLMAEGMLRLRRREGMDKDVPLEPGKVYEAAVDCWSVSLAVNRGHRLRVSVTSSNYPRFDLNPGTGVAYVKGGPTVRQTNRLYCDAARPSHIVLPVVADKTP